MLFEPVIPWLRHAMLSAIHGEKNLQMQVKSKRVTKLEAKRNRQRELEGYDVQMDRSASRFTNA